LHGWYHRLLHGVSGGMSNSAPSLANIVHRVTVAGEMPIVATRTRRTAIGTAAQRSTNSRSYRANAVLTRCAGATGNPRHAGPLVLDSRWRLVRWGRGSLFVGDKRDLLATRCVGSLKLSRLHILSQGHRTQSMQGRSGHQHSQAIAECIFQDLHCLLPHPCEWIVQSSVFEKRIVTNSSAGRSPRTVDSGCGI